MSELRDAFERHVAWTSDAPLGLEVESAEGPYIRLEDGRELVDLISGIAVSALGHRHPEVIEAVRDQLDRHMHVMVYGEMIQEPQVRLAEELVAHLPDPLEKVYFVNSGTEANEGALKTAKKWTGRTGMVAFRRSFHGDTHGSLSVTGRSVYREPFRPLLPEVEFLPFDEVGALEAIDGDTACVITEPIQGEGGMNVPDDRWMRALRERCTETGALLVFDEVQTGLGRTGDLFAFEGFDVVPDVLTLAKAFGGGMPLGAFVTRADVAETLLRDPPLSHVTTFGGHPVSCAAARASLRVITRDRLWERARRIGERVRDRLDHDRVREIRGRGALLGLDLPDAERTRSFVEAARSAGVLVGWTLHAESLVRIAPPLTIPRDVLDESLAILRRQLDRL